MREVFCIKYQKKMPGLTGIPFPGSQGQYIYDNVSLQAWQGWLNHQTMLINEKHLNLVDPDVHKYLAEQRDKFLHNRDHDQPAGYMPEDGK